MIEKRVSVLYPARFRFALAFGHGGSRSTKSRFPSTSAKEEEGRGPRKKEDLGGTRKRFFGTGWRIVSEVHSLQVL